MIIKKLQEAEQHADKALALGMGVILGYEPTTVCGICEMYYILRKWQMKLGIGTLKSLDKLIDDYNASFEAVDLLDEMDAYVAARKYVDSVSNRESNIEDAFIHDQEGTSTMPEIMQILAKCHEEPEEKEPKTPETEEVHYVYPIWLNSKGPVS